MLAGVNPSKGGEGRKVALAPKSPLSFPLVSSALL